MERSFSVAQVTGAIPGGIPTSPHVVGLTKPDSNQAVTLQLDGTVQLDLSSIANMPVTFVHVGDRLVILFDNQATVTLEPFFNGDGTPLSIISVELAPDRSVTGAEFASLFPITQDQSVLPTAGNGAPSSGADFETVTIDQLLNTTTPLGPLNSDSPNGNAPGPAGNDNVAINSPVQGPTLTVHGAAGNEDKPIGLSISDALSIADPRASLGNITIAGIPAGVTFNHGSLSADGKTLTVTPAQLAGLTLTSDGEAQHFNLTVTATTVDGSDTAAAASTTQSLHVDVTPVADAPLLTLPTTSLQLNHFTTVDQAEAATVLFGLNNDNEAVGRAGRHGLIDQGGNLSTFDAPGATATQVKGVNDSGTIVGSFVDGSGAQHGFVQQGTQFTRIDFPGATGSSNSAINNSGVIVGTFVDANGNSHGFLDQGGNFTQIDAPGATLTHALGINAHGQIVVFFDDAAGIDHGFVDTNGTFKTIDGSLPGATSVVGDGINDNGQIVGVFADATGAAHGFVLDPDGTLTVIDVPGTTVFTEVVGINNSGEIDGTFVDSSGEHGFTATGAVTSRVAGNEDTPIALGISAALGEADADAVLTVTISGIPAGVTFSAGTLSLDGKTLMLTTAQLAGLTLTSDGETQHFDLTVTATTVDGGDIATAASTTTKTLHVDVTPVADAPNLTVASASGSEDHAIALNIQPARSEPDADAAISVVTITGIPAGVTFNHGTLSQDGKTLTLTPTQLAGLSLTSDGETQHFDLSVTATTADGIDGITASTTKALHVDVTPVADTPTLTVGGLGPASIFLSLPNADVQSAAINDAGTIVASSENATGGFGFVLPAGATTPTVLDFGNATQAFGINSAGVIAGAVIVGFALRGGTFFGFADTAGQFTPVNDPSAILTEPFGINNNGDIVGLIDTTIGGIQTDEAFAFINGAFALFSINGAPTIAAGVNDFHAIVGRFGSGQDVHGFVTTTLGQSFTQVDVTPAAGALRPGVGVLATEALGINDAGQIVGSFIDTDNVTHGFLDVNGAYTVINGPAGATFTEADGINNFGEIVGDYLDANGVRHAFTDQNGIFTTLSLPVIPSAGNADPGAPKLGINDNGQVVGSFTDAHGLHGFEVTVAATGNEDTPIALGIQASPGEPDADAVLTLTIAGVPAGASLNHGAIIRTDQNGNTTWLVSQADIPTLTLTSDGETQHFDLTVTATTVDGGDTATAASTTATLHVDVTPVADPPSLIVQAPGPTTFFFPDQSDQQGAFLNQAAINDAGTIVGTVEHSSLTDSSVRGFELPAGATTGTFLNFAKFIEAFGINSSGTIVGDFTNGGGDKVHGFVLSPEGTLTTVDFSAPNTNTSGTSLVAINDLGVIVGNAFVNGADHVGFVDRGGVFTTINIEGLGTTQISGIDNAGDIVGSFSTSLTSVDGFILLAGQTTPTIIDVPFASATVTDITGINNSGVIVGFFDGAGLQHGFVDNNGTFVTLDLPDGPATPTGINDNGQVVGTFGNVGFETTIPGIGVDGQPIALGIQAALSEADPDAVLTVRIAGVPIGASLNHGSIVATDASGNTTWVVNAADLPTLTLTSDGEVQHFNLIVTATTVDGGDAATAASVTSQPLHIDVTPVTQAPVFNVTNVSGTEDQAIALNNLLSPQADPDETLTIAITGIPAGVAFNTGTLSADGKTLTLTPDQLAKLTLTSNGETEHFNLTVTATAQDGGAVPASTSATLHVDVTPVPDVTVTVVKEVLGVPGNIVSIPISEAPHELDADASLGPITISGFPANSGISVLFGANQQFQVTPDATGTITLSPDQLTNLALQMPATDLGSFTLHVATTASDGSVTETIHNDIQVLDLPNVQQLDIETVAQGVQPAGQPQGPAGASVNAQIENISSDPQNPIFQFTFNSPADHGSGGSAIAGTDASPTNATASDFFINPTGVGLDFIGVEANPNNNFGLSGGDAGAVGPTGQNLPFDEVVSDVNHTVVIDPIQGVQQVTETKTIVVETPDGPNGGNGAAGGAGSHGTALLDQVIVDRGPGNDNGIFVQVGGFGGNGGRAHPGGDGAPGEPDTAGTITTDTSHSFDSGFSDITVTTELGTLQGLAGSGGTGGAGGAGGTGTATIQNSSFIVSGNNSIDIEDFAEGGSGANGANGGAGGAGIFSDGSRVSGFGGNGGAGGNGADAIAIVQNDTIAGTGDDNISVMLTALGGTGGNGGNGGAGSDDHKTDINQVIVQTVSQDGTLTVDKLHSSTQVITDTDIFGTGGHGGAGGSGGNAFAELLNNDIHVDGSGNIAIQLKVSTVFATSEIDMTGNSIHGGSGPGTISITAKQFLASPVFNFSNNDIETGTGTETIQLVVSNLPLAAVTGSGNHFVGNGANETLDLSGWDRAVDIDFGTGNIKLDAAAGTVSGTISGFANVIGTGHADSFENLSGNISVIGGNAADHFGLARQGAQFDDHSLDRGFSPEQREHRHFVGAEHRVRRQQSVERRKFRAGEGRRRRYFGDGHDQSKRHCGRQLRRRRAPRRCARRRCRDRGARPRAAHGAIDRAFLVGRRISSPPSYSLQAARYVP